MVEAIGSYADTPRGKIAIEIFKCIKKGEAVNRTQLSELFGKSIKTIGKYIDSLRDVWNVNIEYDNNQGRYIICNDGDLKGISACSPLTKDDINLILYTLVQSRAFMPGKINLIQNSLLSLLPVNEAEELKKVIPPSTMSSLNEDIIHSYVRTIREAISEQKKIEFNYRHQNSEKYESYRVTPYSFAWDLGKYYLIAKADNSEELYHYRIDRMRSVTKLDEAGLRAQQFNVEQYLKRTWYMWSGKETRIIVRFKNDAYKVVTERNMSDGRMLEESNERGYFVYEFIANGTEGIFCWLLGLGDAAEILEPVELRRKVKNTIRKMNELYNE